jgi:hypothetical protein
MPQISISGRKVGISWTNEIARRFRYRLGLIGGHPSRKELTNPATAEAAFTRILWALLPTDEHAKFPTPEDLFVALDSDSEEDAQAIFEAVTAIYAEMEPSAEKKTSGKRKPSPKSSLA